MVSITINYAAKVNLPGFALLLNLTPACSSTPAFGQLMALLRKLYAGLKLQVDEAKSEVASAFGRKFLGYALWVAKRAGRLNARWQKSH